MDPLSLAANVISVVSAASDVSKKLKKLLSLRNAPQELLQFLNEISDIQVVLTLVGEASSGFGENNSSDLEIKNHLGELLRRATSTLHEFDNIIQNKVGARSNSTTLTKFSWRAWVQNASRLRELSGALRAIRLDMNHTLTMMTASEIPRLRIRLAEVTAQHSNTETILQRFEEQTTQQIEEVISSVGRIRTGIAAINTENTTQQSIPSSIRVQTSVFSGRSFCSKICLCRCHKFTKYRSPDWLMSLLGKLLIGYSGIPSRPPCNERRCRPNNSSLLTVSYYFPRWFLNSCLISFRDRWSPTEGHAISVRTPRVLHSSTEPIVAMVLRGNIAGIQALFEQGLASPFDTEPLAFDSILSLAAGKYESEICAFLLSQHADPSIENSVGLSAIDRAWSITLGCSPSPEAKSLRNIFERYFDLDDIIHRWGLTILHRIIVGLSPVNLRAQLETTTAEINAPDTIRAETPLQWAIRLSNIEAMKTLIEFGASVNVQNNWGETPLYHAATRGTIKILEILLATMASGRHRVPELGGTTAISQSMIVASDHTDFLKFCLEQRDFSYFTALTGCACYNNRSEFARLLLDAGAHVDSNFPPIGTPLLLGIQQGHHTIVRLLLERGARLDVFDAEMQGILHLVALHGDLEVIQIIASQERVKYLDVEHKDMFKYTALETFDIVRQQYHPDEPPSRFQECREAFVALLNRIRSGAQDNPSTLPRMEEIVSEDSEDGEDVFYDVE